MFDYQCSQAVVLNSTCINAVNIGKEHICVLVHAEELAIGAFVVTYIDFAIVHYFDTRVDCPLCPVGESLVRKRKLEHGLSI